MTYFPSIEKINFPPGQSLSFKRIVRNHRPDQRGRGIWHYHPEYELTLTLKSSGNRFLAYHIQPYTEWDLVLVGPNTPHCWITEEHTEQLVINFRHEVLVEPMKKIQEWAVVDKMLENSVYGVKFTSEISKNVLRLFEKIETKHGYERLIAFFKLMFILSHSSDQEILSTQNYPIKNRLATSSRIEKIYSYILENYLSEDISIAALSSELNLTKSSLSRLVSRIAQKSFTELVIEARLNHACRLLTESELNISEICYKSGFNNLSNFNRAFKKSTRLTPKLYRKMYRAN
jgi:AraC-like DNA-binding protein